MERNAVDMKIMRAIGANGIPFNVLRSPQWIEMVNSIKKASHGYKPLSSEKSRTVLLDECVRDVEKELAQVKDTWYTQGVSIISDGRSRVKHRPLINVIATNSRGAMFMYSPDFSGVEKTGVEISKILTGAIETIGSSNVLQVVTDNVANCKLADERSKRGKTSVKYFLNHNYALSIFRSNSKLELLKVEKTRFASKRLMICREALATTIVLNSWKELVKSGDENARMLASKVTDIIKDDDFWDDVQNVLQITKTIHVL